MPTLGSRKLIKFGSSGLVVTVPKAWARYYHLRPGDRVEIIADGELVIRPSQQEGKRRHERQKV